jgi:hypothetical protein
MPCQRREDAGLRYLHLDYRRVPPQQYLDCLATSVRLVQADPPGALMLIEVAMIPTTSEFLSAVKRANHEVFGPLGTRKVYLGADRMRRSIIRGLTLVAPSVQGLEFTDRAAALAAFHHGRTHRAIAPAASATTSPWEYQV